MDISKEIIRKIEIRNNAKKNTGELEKKSDKQIFLKNSAKYEELAGHLWTVDEHSVLSIHKPIPIHFESGLLKKVIKKIIRKIFEKTLGWYYFPIIEQQSIYNQTCTHILKDLESIIEAQENEIETLKRKVNISYEEKRQ